MVLRGGGPRCVVQDFIVGVLIRTTPKRNRQRGIAKDCIKRTRFRLEKKNFSISCVLAWGGLADGRKI